MRTFPSIALAISFSLCLAAPAAAQIACGDTLTDDVKLTADLACTGTPALIVGADKITIDLNGFTLSGDGDLGDIGIDNSQGFDGVAIKNGTVSGFDECIDIAGDAQKNAVTGVTIRSCTSAAIDLNDADFTKISKSRILGNGFGVRVLADGTRNVIEKNILIGSGVGDSSFAAIAIFGTENVVQKNQLTVSRFSISVGGTNNRVIGNTIDHGVGPCIRIAGASGNQVSKNSLAGCDGEGVLVLDAPSTVVGKNDATATRQDGFVVDGTSDGTVIEKNEARANDRNGVLVKNAPVGVRVDGNVVTGNRLNGINLVSTTASAAKNQAFANGLVGTNAETVAVDGGGNKASGNGEADCIGFACP